MELRTFLHPFFQNFFATSNIAYFYLPFMQDKLIQVSSKAIKILQFCCSPSGYTYFFCVSILSFWMCSDLSLCSFDILVLTTFRSIWITFDTFTCINYYSIKFPLVAELFIFLLVFALFFHIHMYIFPIMHLESSSSDFNTSSSSFIADLTRHTDLLHLITYIFLLEAYKKFFWSIPTWEMGENGSLLWWYMLTLRF
jgi:hypothetical protein